MLQMVVTTHLMLAVSVCVCTWPTVNRRSNVNIISFFQCFFSCLSLSLTAFNIPSTFCWPRQIFLLFNSIH